MAKKLSEIQKKVESSGLLFYEFLIENLDERIIETINNISKQTELLVFSGLIRNFFLKRKEVRDVDIVLESEIDLSSYFKKDNIRKNSFGGYKINFNNTKIDLWYLEKTWAIKYQKPLHLDLKEYIPQTSFFNFSSIIYSYNERKFIFTKEFLKFLQDKEIDVVYKPNVNEALCVVNTFYYSEKYNLKIKNRLKRYIIQLYKMGRKDYESVQKKHFGQVLFQSSEIDMKVNFLSVQLDKSKKEKEKRRIDKNSNLSFNFINKP